MAEGAGAAVNVDPRWVQRQVADGGHGDNRVGLVDFPEIHLAGGPAQFRQ
jgi:hypothetical protein